MRIKGYFLITFAVSALIACQTQLQTASEQHKSVTERWYELANYVKSDLPAYGITVSSRLGVVYSGDSWSYRLQHFRLSKPVNRLQVDLLSPSFVDKYVCSPVCQPVVKYVAPDKRQGYTLLTYMFDRHEYQLYRFYGDLALLNDRLAALSSLNDHRFQEYLDFLVMENKSFDSLQALSAYLKQRLSDKAYADYLKQPWSYYQKLAAANPVNDDELRLSENWTPPETVAWRLDKKDVATAEWQLADQQENKKSRPNRNPSVESSLDHWRRARTLSLEQGDTVCSYEGNLFGYLKHIAQDFLIVEVIGEAKILKDNIVYPAPSGYLFRDSEPFFYKPHNRIERFERDQVAPCKIDRNL